MRELFAGYYGQRLPAPASYRSFITWLADRDLDAARTAWRAVFDGFDNPTLVAARPVGAGRRGVAPVKVPERITRAVSELARSQHTTVNTVLQAGFAQLLMLLTGQRDVAFGTRVSGRPAEVAGAESMVGLLINTVPVRARITGKPRSPSCSSSCSTCTTTHSNISTWRLAIHRATGHEQLFDTLFVYENYPIDTAALSGADGWPSPSSPPANTTLPAVRGGRARRELVLRVEFDTEVFDAPASRRSPSGCGGCWWR
ncbi:condensation domain protein [Mycobacterium xenopi 4042]|uniref:Condensation domain protein n=1 Tax=Mycobacterium xenopi 4042 TaxID=1299334 RepID=X8AP26_MYCXE|nr:condensation domain protein [Mycobacterium xenopi 4042]